MKKAASDTLETPIASLIDVVFLLIIFFVVTAAVEKDIVDENIVLAQAKEVEAAQRKAPNTITINLEAGGKVNIARQPLSLAQLQRILTAMVERQGNAVPVLIRADAVTPFEKIDRVMEVIGRAGLYRVKLAAVTSK